MSRPLPFKCDILDKEPVEIQNPYTGQGIVLEPDAIAVYDCIKGAEYVEDFDMVQKGIEWFQKHYPKEYMVLLD